MTVENLAWCLPRPRLPYYPGGVPLHLEKKLLAVLEKPQKILQPFGGRGENGIRLDINPDVCPDILADAHYLPFADDTFELVFLDPPYSDILSDRIYKTGKINHKKVSNEAVRVCRPGGYVVWYHMLATPLPYHTVLTHRILVETRPWHTARIIHVCQKDVEGYHEKGSRYKLGGCPLCGVSY